MKLVASAETLPFSSQAAHTSRSEIVAESRPLLWLLGAAVIFVLGAIIRLSIAPGDRGLGNEASIYRRYVVELDQRGFASYPAMSHRYLDQQRLPEAQAELPPTRAFYIGTAWMLKQACFGDAAPTAVGTLDARQRDPALASLRCVSLWVSIFTVGLVGLAVWRMVGPPAGLGAMALTAASPLSIHLGTLLSADGFFAFWATLCVWLLWENLQRPYERIRLLALWLALGLLVMTQESAVFVLAGLYGMAAVSQWGKFGKVTRPVLIAIVGGPLLGVLGLAQAVGGVPELVAIFRSFATKTQMFSVGGTMQESPWHHHFLAWMRIDPVVGLFAATGLFTLPLRLPAYRYLLGFFVVTCLLACSVSSGLGLCFAAIWALPLSAFAAVQIFALASRWRNRAMLLSLALFGVVAAFGLWQYRTSFLVGGSYEMNPKSLLKATRIVKDPASSRP